MAKFVKVWLKMAKNVKEWQRKFQYMGNMRVSNNYKGDTPT